MLEAGYTENQGGIRQPTNHIGQTQELAPIFLALSHLEGEIKNLICSIDLLQSRLGAVTYYTTSAEKDAPKPVPSGSLVFEQIKDRAETVYLMRMRLNSIIEALQV